MRSITHSNEFAAGVLDPTHPPRLLLFATVCAAIYFITKIPYIDAQWQHAASETASGILFARNLWLLGGRMQRAAALGRSPPPSNRPANAFVCGGLGGGAAPRKGAVAC